MVENIKLIVIESHWKILDVIGKNIGTLVNFSCHSGFPLCSDVIFDADMYSDIILKNSNILLDSSWLPVLVSRGHVCKYIFMYPHECGKDDIKKFISKRGDCEVYGIRFQNKTKIPYKCIVIDMGFFGTRYPLNWHPKDRMRLFIDIFESLSARNITLIITKSSRHVNYNAGEFLEDIINEMSMRANIDEVV